MNEMDRDLPSCLQVLRHVYRRGLDWFQQVSVFSFGVEKCVLVQVTHGCALWTKWTAILQFLLNKMDCNLPSCLRVLWHVYRRGLDWFQQCQSFGWFGLPVYFGSFHALTHAGLDAADGFIAIHHEREGARPSFLFASTSAWIEKRPWWLWIGGNGCMDLIFCICSIHLTFLLCTTLNASNDFITIPQERDISRPSFFFASTLACIKKRSWLVPTALVLYWLFSTTGSTEYCKTCAMTLRWRLVLPKLGINRNHFALMRACLCNSNMKNNVLLFGLLICFGPFCRTDAHSWMKCWL